MPATTLSNLTSMKTGDLIDAIHDIVCELGQESAVTQEECDELFYLVEELRNRSIEQSASRNNEDPSKH